MLVLNFRRTSILMVKLLRTSKWLLSSLFISAGTKPFSSCSTSLHKRFCILFTGIALSPLLWSLQKLSKRQLIVWNVKPVVVGMVYPANYSNISQDTIELLTLILNQSISTGIFSDKCKIARVFPFFKKGNNQLLEIINQFQSC